jgi:hypothetical protein
VWVAGRVEPYSPARTYPDLTSARFPILAIGSNASPAQLTRKFRDERFADPSSPDGCIPVLAAEVDGVDVVYGAHLAGYGALPATLIDTPGACAHVYLTWLTAPQLERMNVTEGLGQSYQLIRMAGVRSQGKGVDDVLSYVTVDGVAILGGGPLGLASIQTPGSSWPRGGQQQAWDILSADMGCGLDGVGLLHRVLHSQDWRARVESHLASHRLAETHAPSVA